MSGSPDPAGSATPDARPATVERTRDGQRVRLVDTIAVEAPLALVYNGEAHAVMLGTPVDLRDFAVGFSIAEAIIADPGEILAFEAVTQPEGIELRLNVPPARADALRGRERTLAGRTGCGLCGVRALGQAVRYPARVAPGVVPDAAALGRALTDIGERQVLNRATGAAHAAAWCTAAGDVALLREDLGRHNALDKLIGALAQAGTPLRDGWILVTSRASFEMVQKAANAGIGTLVAMSAPTSLAIDVARACGVTLIGFARAGGHVLYTPAEPA